MMMAASRVTTGAAMLVPLSRSYWLPGTVDILSTVPGSQYERDSGTSMAAPVVTRLAAIIMSTVSKHDQMVLQPGSKTKVPFASLSVSGGIVNAYEALKMAEQVSNGKAR